MRVVEGARVPVRIWARSIDDDALRQLTRLADRPWVVEAVCAMPDVHLAHGVSVGTVFATHDVVVPGALGGDLGCGIAAARVPGGALELDRRALEDLLERLSARVPVGDRVHRSGSLPEALRERPLSTNALSRTRDRLGPRHLGTLGGGNHFLELDRDVDGDLWILVHSGSRGLGAAVADAHRKADALEALPLSGEGAAFLTDLEFALAFAAHNRARMLELACAIVHEMTGCEPSSERIDVHHNHVAREGERLVHRKGAIAAHLGARAIIPGSMATASYVVEGLGDRRAFCSASHGAGRRMTRTDARRTLSHAQVERALRRIVVRCAGDVREEAPQAYRDLGEVLEDERDLVTPLLRLEPMAVLKG